MKKWKIAALTLALPFLGFAGLSAYWASLPDFEVGFLRQVPSTLSPDALAPAFKDVTQWHLWHHLATEIRLVDARGAEYSYKDQVPMVGAIVRYKMQPRGKSHRKFMLTGLVTHYEPGKKITVLITKDSSGKLSTILDQVQWEIELLSPPVDAPSETQTLIQGRLTAKTNSWKSRVFSKLIGRAFLNQSYYPDLIALSTFQMTKDFQPLPLLGP